MRCARGQGTVEYLAVVLLVAMVFGGTATVASGSGGEIGSEVTRQLHRALCIVRSGDCYRDLAPCDVATNSDSESWAVTVAVFKFGRDTTVTVTERSDRTFAVTLHKVGVGGIETAVGARGGFRRGDRRISAGADITAAITGSLGRGRTWIARSKQEAEQFLAVIEIDADALPPADIEDDDKTLDLGINASAGGDLRVSGGAGAQLEGGSRLDRRTGNRTYFLTAGVSGQAGASARDTAGVSIEGASGDRYALTVDRNGRWLDLAVTRTGALSGNADLPDILAPLTDQLDVPTAGARRWITESHLDLTEAQNLAAVRRLVTRLGDPRNPGAIGSALADLSRRMDEAAVVDARTYAVSTDGTGVEGHVALEVKVGGHYEQSTESTRLLAARTRGIDGRWRDRRECVQKEEST